MRDASADFIASVRARRPVSQPGAGLNPRIVAANRYSLCVHDANPGLMRCLVQLRNVLPGFAPTGQEANIALAARLKRGGQGDAA